MKFFILMTISNKNYPIFARVLKNLRFTAHEKNFLEYIKIQSFSCKEAVIAIFTRTNIIKTPGNTYIVIFSFCINTCN